MALWVLKNQESGENESRVKRVKLKGKIYDVDSLTTAHASLI